MTSSLSGFLHKIMSCRCTQLANVSDVDIRLQAKYEMGLQKVVTVQQYPAAAGGINGRLTLIKAAVAQPNDQRPAAPQLQSTIKQSTSWLRFPAIDSIFTVKCHPDYYRGLRDECDAWTLSLFDPPLSADDPRRLMYLQCLLPLFLCVFYSAAASSQRIRLNVMLNLWLFILDDLLDQADAHTALQLRCGLEAVLISTDNLQLERANNVADLPASCSASTRVASFLKRLKDDVWDEMCKHMTPPFRARLAASLLDSLDAAREQTQPRESTSCAHLTPTSQYNNTAATMSLDDFMALRERSSFIQPAVYMSQFCLGIDIQHALLSLHGSPHHDLKQHIEDLERAVSKHTIWVNDIFSSFRELARNDEHSLLGFFLTKHIAATDNDAAAQHQVLQTIVDKIWSMIQEQETISAQILEEIQKKGSDLRVGHGREVVEYAEAICNAMAGNIYWSTITGRYQGSSFIPWNTPIYMPTILDLVVINPAVVAGPRQSCGRTNSTMLDQSGIFAYVHVDDLASAHVLAFEAERASGRYICFEKLLSKADILEAAREMYPNYPVASRLESFNPCVLSNEKLKDLGMTFEQGVLQGEA